jgi:uncharacterized protein YbbC (DUF1343 family)
MRFLLIFMLFFISSLPALTKPKVLVGADLIFNEDYVDFIRGKKIGVLSNHTAVNRKMQSTVDLLKQNAKKFNYTVVALFAPEHGQKGAAWAADFISDEKDPDGIPIYSLYGERRRPTPDMLKKIDVLLFDIQDIGSRSYTYISTLFYVMEEAAKQGTTVVVLDRPNPITGLVVDGPMLEEKWRSHVGYINIPYCHGMTVGELAQFFNGEYKVGCKLKVVAMDGWRRYMTYNDTGLPWIPTSPNIPEPNTAFYYPATGILGELQIVNIGIGYTLPFKLIGAPWIDAKKFVQTLNAQQFPGVYFEPFHYRPFYGRFAHEDCQGALIVITDPLTFKPVSTQYLLIGILKGLYPEKFKEALAASKERKEMFCKVNGTQEVYRIIAEENNIVWKLKTLYDKERQIFMDTRKKYLVPTYSDE